MNFAAGGPVTPADSKNLPTFKFLKKAARPRQSAWLRGNELLGLESERKRLGVGVGGGQRPGGTPVAWTALLGRSGTGSGYLASGSSSDSAAVSSPSPSDSSSVSSSWATSSSAPHPRKPWAVSPLSPLAIAPVLAGVGAAHASPGVLRLTALCQGPRGCLGSRRAGRGRPKPLNRRRQESFATELLRPGLSFPWFPSPANFPAHFGRSSAAFVAWAESSVELQNDPPAQPSI